MRFLYQVFIMLYTEDFSMHHYDGFSQIGSHILNWKFLMQQPTDQSVGQRKDIPGQYLDIALVPGQYLDIALVAGQYRIYCLAMAYYPPMQSVT